MADSVAATIYSVWRNQFLRGTVVATLDRLGRPSLNSGRHEILAAARRLLDGFDSTRGVGASGVDFFAIPGIDDAATRRDLVILRSLSRSLDLLAGDAYAMAFQRSTRQEDYRWGILHRVMLDHPLGPPFSIPGARSLPAAARPGAGRHPGRRRLSHRRPRQQRLFQDSADAFVFAGPSSASSRARVVARASRRSAFPGQSASWSRSTPTCSKSVTNDTHKLRQGFLELAGHIDSIETILPVSP